MRIYIGNLSRDVTEDDLSGLFQPFGKLGEVTIVKDRYNNVSKGFGFVEMPEKSEAEAAIAALHRKELKGQTMDVTEARPRTERRSGGRPGGWNSGRKGGGGRRW